MALHKITADAYAAPDVARNATKYLTKVAAPKAQSAKKIVAAGIVGRAMEVAAPFPEFSEEALARIVRGGKATFPTLRKCDL